MKGEILAQLQAADVVSGESLSQLLGVSRVAVWKHIRQLQELGYEIEASSKGYRLRSAPDAPFPWVFGQRAAQVHYFPETSSTMDIAMEMARQGCPNFTIVVAERQTKGRGRLQRSWHSERGGLYFTMVLRPRMPLALAPLINLAASVDLAMTLDALYGIQARLKWPNDVLVEGRKLAGILSQMAAETDRIEYVNVGIGVNVHNDTSQVDPPAISTARLTSEPVSRAEILAHFWERFERRLATGRWSDVVAEWKSRSATLGLFVRVQTLYELYEGRAVDVENNGGLILEKADGTRMTIVYGDCFHP
mgnify:CR=1 FL=1